MAPIASTLIVRCDAGTTRGTGHAMRSLALADAWSSTTGEDVRFVMADTIEGVDQRIRLLGYEVQRLDAEPASRADTEAVIETRSQLEAGPVVVDGYHFPPAYLKRLRKHASPLTYLDDTVHLEEYPVDLFVNPSSGIRPGDIPESEPEQLLLGPDYVLLRPEFHTYRGWERRHPEDVDRLLVTLGGSDPVSATPGILDQIAGESKRLERVEVVTRATNEDVDEIRDILNRMDPATQLSLDVDDMARRMEQADLAICAGGTTAWELAFMQVPMILTRLASNQREVGASVVGAGAAWDLGPWSQIDASEAVSAVQELSGNGKRREKMGRAGRALVDGRGAERVVEAMRRW